jgi:adenosylmethionine-8-amino-7-oxononanoate aminotransferase
VLEEVPKLLPRVRELADRFDDAGWEGKGLLRITDGGDHGGVLLIPVGDRAQAAPPYTLTDDELDEASARLAP